MAVPGTMPQMTGFGRNGAGIELTYLDFAESFNSKNITGPALILAGDLLVHLQWRYWTGSTPTAVVPTGFSSLVNFAGIGNTRGIISFKIADGSEANAVIAGMNSQHQSQNFMIVSRPSAAISGINTTTFAGQGTNSDPDPRVIAAASLDPASIGMALFYHTASPVITFSPVSGNTTKTGNNCNTYWAIQNGSPVNISVDMNDAGGALMMIGGAVSVY